MVAGGDAGDSTSASFVDGFDEQTHEVASAADGDVSSPQAAPLALKRPLRRGDANRNPVMPVVVSVIDHIEAHVGACINLSARLKRFVIRYAEYGRRWGARSRRRGHAGMDGVYT